MLRFPAVTVGIALPALTAGLTSFYTKSSAIAAFLSTFNQTVLTLMTFPELLMWTIGNEISLGSVSGLTQSTNTGLWSGSVSIGWANMWSLVGTLTAIIHALDPYHPVGTCTPNINLDGARPAAGGAASAPRRACRRTRLTRDCVRPAQ